MSTFVKHQSYRVQKHCKKCEHVLVIVTDADDMLYCHSDKAMRPPCPWGIFDMTSALVATMEGRDKVRRRERGEWDTWSKPRKVDAAGYCDDYKYRPGPHDVKCVGPDWG